MAKRIAHDKQQSLGKTISELITGATPQSSGEPLFTIQPNGLPLFRSGRPITTEDVRYYQDEEWLYDETSS